MPRDRDSISPGNLESSARCGKKSANRGAEQSGKQREQRLAEPWGVGRVVGVAGFRERGLGGPHRLASSYIHPSSKTSLENTVCVNMRDPLG